MRKLVVTALTAAALGVPAVVSIPAARAADTEPPTITVPADRTVKAASPTYAAAVDVYPPPTASDNAPGVTAACFPQSGAVFELGTTTVTCTASDASGNVASKSFTVTVVPPCDAAHTITAPATSLAANDGQAWCLYKATIDGSIAVSGGSSLILQRSTVNGIVSANGSGFVTACSSKLGHVSIAGATGLVFVGLADANCPPNNIGGLVNLARNSNGAARGNNTITGSVAFNDNGGAFPPTVAGNIITGSLSCRGDGPAITNTSRPNTVYGFRSGQCAAL